MDFTILPQRNIRLQGWIRKIVVEPRLNMNSAIKLQVTAFAQNQSIGERGISSRPRVLRVSFACAMSTTGVSQESISHQMLCRIPDLFVEYIVVEWQDHHECSYGQRIVHGAGTLQESWRMPDLLAETVELSSHCLGRIPK